MALKYEIEEKIAVLSEEEDSNGFVKELNLVSWNGRKPKYDIRGWKNNHDEMTRGITLNAKEMFNRAQSAIELEGGLRNG